MSGFSTEELLRRAVVDKATGDWTLTSSDFGGATEAPLGVDQAQAFITLMTAAQVVLSDVRTVTSKHSKWQESGLDFSGRILKPGTQGERLGTSDRSKAATFPVELSTVLVRGEVPVADEAYEDAAASDLQTSISSLIADRAGFDLEDFFLNGDTSLNDGTINDLADGWLKLAQGSGANQVDGSALGQDYEKIFNRLLTALPDRFKRNLTTDGRFYVPQRLEEKYREQLAQRGTVLGDQILQGTAPLKYQGINIVGVPAIGITAGATDTSTVLLTNRNNLYAGFQRKLTFESFRDPREGATSFIVTARVAPAVAVVNATAVATSVDVEP